MKKKTVLLLAALMCLAALLPCAAGEHVRTVSEQYAFTASPDAETEIRDLIFDGDVTVSGAGQNVRFWNCEFLGDVINTAATQTVVWIMPDCSFAETCHCVINNGLTEATIDYSIPKFALCFPVDVESYDLGGVIAVDSFDIRINDTVYTAQDVEWYLKSDGSMVPYEEGMPVGTHIATRWWENGEEIVYTVGVEPEA